jgi:hypothetical protein
VLLLDSGSNGDRRGKCRKKRRNYMTVDFATTASQQGFSNFISFRSIENLNDSARLNCLKSWEEDKRLK